MIVKTCVLLAAIHLFITQCGYERAADQPEPGTTADLKDSLCPPCSIEAVTAAEQHMDSLNREEFLCFIGTFDPRCITNVEYSEYSNEVLFSVLLKHPEYLIHYVAEKKREKGTEYILARLSAPVSDAVPSEQYIKAVSEAEGSPEGKGPIIQALKAIPR